ncbi:MAG: hypothetical protein JWO42_3739 [Chloroflexi bacterium]|nr:hypothetical protein [Chloroflexota bacterium]
MRAVRLREYGPPEVLVQEELPDPLPGVGQVVVDVAAIGVNFADTMLRSGRTASATRPRPPFVPGNEVGGVVSAVGEGVDAGLLSRRVITGTGGTGGYAERVAVAADGVFPVPEGLNIETAVALFAQGRTAVGVAREARIAPGDHVLVEAAAGGVGSLLVQIARNAGAGMVIAAARGTHKLALAQRLGADVTVDYGRADWADRVSDATGGDGIDVAFDSVGGIIGRAAFDLLAGAGRFVVFGFSSGMPVDVTVAEVQRRGVTVIGFGPPRVGRPGYAHSLVSEALAEAAAGRLIPVIGQTFPLDQAAAAHAAIEARATTGKTLLIP